MKDVVRLPLVGPERERVNKTQGTGRRANRLGKASGSAFRAQRSWLSDELTGGVDLGSRSDASLSWIRARTPGIQYGSPVASLRGAVDRRLVVDHQSREWMLETLAAGFRGSLRARPSTGCSKIARIEAASRIRAPNLPWRCLEATSMLGDLLG